MWHHVYHRGIARRAVFERPADWRFFLALLARSVRRGEIEVHAFCLLTNHFHLLLRSVNGELSVAMKRTLNAYVRYFNATRARDGSLFSGRFRSIGVQTRAYRRILVRYIDDNPVSAGMARDPADHAFGSAFWYAQARRPAWLCRTWVEEEVRQSWSRSRSRDGPYDPSAYAICFRPGLSECMRRLVTRRLASPRRVIDKLDLLVDAAPPALRQWFVERARLADGGVTLQAMATPEMVEAAMADAAHACPRLPTIWLVRRAPNARPVSGWDVVRAGLLRDLCGLGWSELRLRLGLESAALQRRLELHRDCLLVDPLYLERCAALAAGVFARVSAEVCIACPKAVPQAMRRARERGSTAGESDRLTVPSRGRTSPA